MTAARRSTSARSTRLAAKGSPYHSAVTLYEAAGQSHSRNDHLDDAGPEPGAGPSVRRRSTRKRGRVELSPEVQASTPNLSPTNDDEQTGLAVKKGQVSSERVHKIGASVADDDSELDNTKPTQPDTAETRRKRKRKSSTVPNVKVDNASGKSPVKKPTSKPKAIPQSLAVPHPAPEGWEEVYAAIKEMRSRIVAPVDTMGCDQAQWREQDPKNRRFATLVSLMLSSQTKDEITDAAVERLRIALGGAVSVQAVLEADESTISDAIAKVGFWRRKTQYIKQTAQRLRDDFDSDVPKTVDELCSLPGVGPKMAFLALQIAWNLNLGIGVDVHVHRITNRLGWHNRPTKNPEETRLNLQSWLPKALHGDINHLLVGFGQTICLPIGPKCGECTLSTGDMCPSAQKSTKTRTKTSKASVRKGSSSKQEDGPKIELEVEPLGDHEGVPVKEEE